MEGGFYILSILFILSVLINEAGPEECFAPGRYKKSGAGNANFPVARRGYCHRLQTSQPTTTKPVAVLVLLSLNQPHVNSVRLTAHLFFLLIVIVILILIPPSPDTHPSPHAIADALPHSRSVWTAAHSAALNRASLLQPTCRFGSLQNLLRHAPRARGSVSQYLLDKIQVCRQLRPLRPSLSKILPIPLDQRLFQIPIT